MMGFKERAVCIGTALAWLTVPAAAEFAGIVSDDFNSCAVNEAYWSVVNPQGLASVETTGAGTPDAHAVISIPAGASHDAWATDNQTVRLMQAAPDTDFEVRVKFDSMPTAAYQTQGLLVEQSNDRYLRFDVLHNGKTPSLFAATFADQSAVVRGHLPIDNAMPVTLSLSRTGQEWTLRYSQDGQTFLDFARFSFRMKVARVGPFAGTFSTSTAPAWDVHIDWFENVAAPLLEEDAPGSVGASLTAVAVGEGTVTASPDKTLYDCGETVTLTAEPAPGWLFDQWSGDISGTEPTQTVVLTGSRNVQATFTKHIPPLVITDVAVAPAHDSARIAWSTSNPATTRVRYGQTPAYELGEVARSEFETHHTVELTKLSKLTRYHYVIECTDEDGQTATTPDSVFETPNSPPPGTLTSDDFSHDALDPELWTIINPTGQAAFELVGAGTTDARLRISLPAGAEHSAWTQGIRTPWVKQRITNTDFSVEVKFDSELREAYQAQGLIVQQDDDTFIRTDFYSDGSRSFFHAGIVDNGTGQTLANAPVAVRAPYFVRLTRDGDQWIIAYSGSGRDYVEGTRFRRAMNVTGLGPFVGNQGSPAPAFAGLIDYFFNTDNPIELEDGHPPPDLVAPRILDIQTLVHQTSIDVLWKTDEPAVSNVSYGTTTAYELGSRSDSTLRMEHAIGLVGLQPSTTYHLNIASTDSSGNTGKSGDITVTTLDAPNGPVVDIWYGDTQQFGHIGQPVPAINVLGNAKGNISSLHYSLNGGAFNPLSKGPNSRRLAQTGDFNVEIPFANLQPGSNSVAIRVRDSGGRETIRTVSVVKGNGGVWPIPYSIDWGRVSNINDVAQVIDGLWEIKSGAVRPVVQAYDRLIAIGDRTWEQYEVTCPITVYSIDSSGHAAPSYGPGVGVLLRWPGHSNDGGQPWQGVYPLGAIGMFRWTTSGEQWQLFGNNGRILDASDDPFQLGVTYMFKMRVQNTAGGAEYRLKYWRSGQAEPGGWQLTGTQTAGEDPGRGCILLLAHHVDAHFGNVTVTSVP
ncbi:MAG TPA: DUF1349 domain-containing protein [Phycisphaerae bacterium]|nr:DUF1349 domain-containing protein [Phycisphaerae bacterium]